MNARPFLLATAAAALLVAAQEPLAWFPAAMLATAPIALLARERATARTRYLAAYLGGLATFAVGCHWLAHSSPANLVMMAVAEALALPMTVVLVRLRRDPGAAVPALWLAAAFTAVEFARSRLPWNGFPWLLLGYGAVRPLELAQAGDLVGVHGLTFLMAWCGGLAANAAVLRRGRGLRLAGAAAIPLTLYAYGAWRIPQVDRLERPGPRVALVQANIPQRLKRRNDAVEILEAHRELSLEARQRAGADGFDLLVWPETMAPPFTHDAEPAPGDRQAQVFAANERAVLRFLVPEVLRPTGAHALLGSLTLPGSARGRGEHYNSAVLFDPKGRRMAVYDKAVRVPGGEFIPLRAVLPAFVDDWVESFAGYLPALLPGDGPNVLEIPGPERPWRFAPTICYENNYPGYNALAARPGVDFLLNLSNEAWFLDSVEMDQMEAASRLRAIETRRALVRATNSGITAIYDAVGRRRHALTRDGRDREIAGVLLETVPVSHGRSLYVAAGDVMGLFSTVACAVAALVFLARRYRRSRPM